MDRSRPTFPSKTAPVRSADVQPVGIGIRTALLYTRFGRLFKRDLWGLPPDLAAPGVPGKLHHRPGGVFSGVSGVKFAIDFLRPEPAMIAAVYALWKSNWGFLNFLSVFVR